MNAPKLPRKLVEKLETLTPKQLVLLAVVTSAFVAAIIYGYLSSFTGTVQDKKIQAVTDVVVATVDIPERTVINDGMLKVVKVPTELVQTESVTDVKAAVGKVSKLKVMQGDVLTEKKLYDEGNMAGFIGSIPADRRAVSVAITDVTGVSGFAKPGDRVDVMLISDKAYKNAVSGEMILQNIVLLGINKNNDVAEDAKDAKNVKNEKMATATLAVKPEDAVRLAAAQANGQIYLAMRPFKPNDSYAIVPEVLLSRAAGQDQASQPAPAANPALAAQPYYPAAQYNQALATAISTEVPGYSVSVIRGNTVSAVQVK